MLSVVTSPSRLVLSSSDWRCYSAVFRSRKNPVISKCGFSLSQILRDSSGGKITFSWGALACLAVAFTPYLEIRPRSFLKDSYSRSMQYALILHGISRLYTLLFSITQKLSQRLRQNAMLSPSKQRCRTNDVVAKCNFPYSMERKGGNLVKNIFSCLKKFTVQFLHTGVN